MVFDARGVRSVRRTARNGRNPLVLAPILFIIAFMVALTGAVLDVSFHAAKTAFRTTLTRYCDASIADGVADLTHGLAEFVQVHGTAGPWPQSVSESAARPVCSAVDAQPAACSLRYIIRASITAASSAGVDATPASDPASNLQASVIDEQRVSAIVVITIVTSAGASVATRTRFLTYRVFATAPYAVISGSRDITTEDLTASAAQGDSGGSALPSTVAASQSSDAPGDTRIHVRLSCRTVIPGVVPFNNDEQVIGNDGLPWGDTPQAAYETPCTSADAPADVFRDETWHNGDANASGWTQ